MSLFGFQPRQLREVEHGAPGDDGAGETTASDLVDTGDRSTRVAVTSLDLTAPATSARDDHQSAFLIMSTILVLGCAPTTESTSLPPLKSAK